MRWTSATRTPRACVMMPSIARGPPWSCLATAGRSGAPPGRSDRGGAPRAPRSRCTRRRHPGKGYARHSPSTGGASVGCKAELEECLDPGTTALQCRHELSRRDPTVIDARRSPDAVLATERLDPSAPGVVKVSGDRADRAWCGPGNREDPELRG